MITGIGIQNFRVFDEMTQIDFAPITVLTGRNNSGKSSVLKALLLLQDNARKNNLTELDFNSSTHQLGTFQEALSKNKKRNQSDEMVLCVKNDVVDEVATHLFFGSENIILEQKYKLDDNARMINWVLFILFFYSYVKSAQHFAGDF